MNHCAVTAEYLRRDTPLHNYNRRNVGRLISFSSTMNQPDVDDNSSDNYEVQYLEHPAGIVEEVHVQNVTGESKKDESPTTTATRTERLSDAASIQSASPLRPNDDGLQDNVSSSLLPPSPTRSAHAVATEDRNISRRRSITDVRFILFINLCL